MPTLTQGPSAEDCSSHGSSCFQTTSRRSRPQAPAGPSAAASNSQLHPTSRRQQPATNQRKRRGPPDDDSAEERTGYSVTAAPEPDDDADVAPIAVPASDPNSAELSVVDGKTRRYSRISMIIIYGREALCILALLLTTYATIQNTPPKVAKAPPPVPFFSRGSLVSDFPSGALGTAQARVAVTELSLVFYYAPWCAESQYARQAYEAVAQLYHREAHFVAINCWQPGGECRQRYTKVLSWPVLMAYQPNGFVIQYHQAWTAGALSRFVQSLVAPLQRFVNPADLMDRMTGKDAVIVAFLEVTNESELYHQYYQAAVKWLEKDPFQEVSFGVVTGESCKLFGVETQPSIRLYLWNETIEYVGKESWTPRELNGWLVKHLQVVSMWFAPPGSKSSTIAPYFRQGPVLFLFNPRPLYAEGDSSDAYMMLRQLSMHYYNCAGDTWVQEMAREYIAEQRLVALERYAHRKVQCGSILGRHPSQDDDEGRGTDGRRRRRGGIDRSTVSVSFVNVLNASKFADGRKLAGHSGGSEPDSAYCDIAPALAGRCQPAESCGARFGPERKPSLRWSGTGQQQEEEEGCPARAHATPEASEVVTSSAIDSTHDYRGPKLLTKQYLRRQCELFRLAEGDGTHLFYPEPEGEPDTIYAAVGGLSCKHNKTLTFLSMDSTLSHSFSERLGVDVLQEPNRTVAFIVDSENESTYALRSPINLRTLARFVHDYYNRSLERFQRSSNIRYEHTHHFDAIEMRRHQEQLLVELNRTREREASEKRQKQASNAEAQTDGSEPSMVVNDSTETPPTAAPMAPREYHAIREIYSTNFRRVVLETNRTVVVNFYSIQCAFCGILSHYLLTVSRLLRHQPQLEFVRIDGERNDLDWEYTMDVFPALIIFPGPGRKSESRIFPHTERINVPNVLSFVLSNLSPTERLHATFLLCSTANKASSTDCLNMLQHELSDGIRVGLRDWRRQPCARERILRRLQLLKHSYLDTLRCLSHSCDLNRLANSRKQILQLWPIVAPSERVC